MLRTLIDTLTCLFCSLVIWWLWTFLGWGAEIFPELPSRLSAMKYIHILMLSLIVRNIGMVFNGEYTEEDAKKDSPA